MQIDENVHLARIFSSEILGRLPTAGTDRIRRTTLGLIETYASWFTTQNNSESPLLINAMAYIVAALPEQALCLSAATALQKLCDSNRVALAKHMSSFADLHAGVNGLPDAEKSKVLQSIASVIQALPAGEEIPPILAIVTPVVEKLAVVLGNPMVAQLPDEVRELAVSQLNTLAGVCKGLTRTSDPMMDDDPDEQLELDKMDIARMEDRIVRLRGGLFDVIRVAMERWSSDAGVADVRLCP